MKLRPNLFSRKPEGAKGPGRNDPCPCNSGLKYNVTAFPLSFHDELRMRHIEQAAARVEGCVRAISHAITTKCFILRQAQLQAIEVQPLAGAGTVLEPSVLVA